MRTAPRSPVDAPARSAPRSPVPGRRSRTAHREHPRESARTASVPRRSAGLADPRGPPAERRWRGRSRPGDPARHGRSCGSSTRAFGVVAARSSSATAVGGSTCSGPEEAVITTRPSERQTHSRASPAPSTSTCAVSRAAAPISAGVVALTSARLARRSARSRVTVRSFCLTRPRTRAITSRKTTIDAPTMSSRSKSPRRASRTKMIEGATSDAAVRRARRNHDRRRSRSGVASVSVRIDGCSAAAPHRR